MLGVAPFKIISSLLRCRSVRHGLLTCPSKGDPGKRIHPRGWIWWSIYSRDPVGFASLRCLGEREASGKDAMPSPH